MKKLTPLCCACAAFTILIFDSPLLVQSACADSATWSATAGSGDWDNPANWNPMAVPDGPSDIATFSVSNQTSVFFHSHPMQLAAIVFDASASSFTLSDYASVVTIGGPGIINNSGLPQTFTIENHVSVFGDVIRFINGATAGVLTTFVNAGSSTQGNYGGYTQFLNSSNAGEATFISNGGSVAGGYGGHTRFDNSSSAANATFFVNGGAVANAVGGDVEFFGNSTSADGVFTVNAGAVSGTNGNYTAGGTVLFADSATAANAVFTIDGTSVAEAFGGDVEFQATSTAGNGTFINYGSSFSTGASGGRTRFFMQSSAGNALLVANGGSRGGEGGSIIFSNDSIGGTARVQVFGNGNLDIGLHNAPGMTIGSIEGSGQVFLGGNNLSIGSNNLSTVFSGVIQDRGIFNRTGGSITKIGTGTLTLFGQNTYTGPTTINEGSLIVNGSITSNVTVNGGRLGGAGNMRDVTVNSGGTLAPGNSPGILNVQGNLVLNLGANYLVELNGTVVGSEYDQTNVTGSVTLAGATLTLNVGFTPAVGTMFTIINNDSNDSVTGTFSGLPEGATFTQGGQTFTISYQGRDGNDVTLTTVVPEPNAWILSCAGTAVLSLFKSRRRMRQLLRRR